MTYIYVIGTGEQVPFPIPMTYIYVMDQKVLRCFGHGKMFIIGRKNHEIIAFCIHFRPIFQNLAMTYIYVMVVGMEPCMTYIYVIGSQRVKLARVAPACYTGAAAAATLSTGTDLLIW